MSLPFFSNRNSMVGTMSENTLNATLRTTQGKSSTQLIRRNGKIPAILYGPRGNFSLEMDEESTRQSLEKLNNIHELVHLKINDASGENWEGKVLLKEIQKHSYKNKLIHLDFLEPSKDKPLNINIQIREKGECPGVKEGGRQNPSIHRSRCLYSQDRANTQGAGCSSSGRNPAQDPTELSGDFGSWTDQGPG